LRRVSDATFAFVPFVIAAVWSDAFSAAGATAAVIATVGGAVVAIRYGRKATAQIEASVYEAGNTILLAARPSVRAVGVFRLAFADDCRTTVTEVWTTREGLVQGRKWGSRAVFGPSFVEAGETIWTTVVFDLGPPSEYLVGWRAVFDVTVSRRFGRNGEWVWNDRIFVPSPSAKPVA
jgi:hypothetical protein